MLTSRATIPYATAILVLVLLTLGFGCARHRVGETEPDTASVLELNLQIERLPTDAPAYFIIDRIELHDVNNRWVTLDVGQPAVIGTTGDGTSVLSRVIQSPLSAGIYDSLRLSVRFSRTNAESTGDTSVLSLPATNLGASLEPQLAVPQHVLARLNAVLVVDAPSASLDSMPVLHMQSTSISIAKDKAVSLQVNAREGGTLSLPSGMKLEVPPNALPHDETISVVELAEGENALGPLFQFFPEGLQFLKPVRVTLPYFSGSGVPTHIRWDGQDLQTTINTSSKTMSAEIVHFSVGEVVGDEEVFEPIGDFHGVRIFKGKSGGTTYAVAIADLWSPEVRVEGMEGPTLVQGNGTQPTATNGDEWNDGSKHDLATLKSMIDVRTATGKVAVATNTVAWEPKNEPGGEHWYSNSAAMNGTWRRFMPFPCGNSSKCENKAFFPALASSSHPARILPASTAGIPGDAQYNVVGSRTSILWQGKFATSSGVAYTGNKTGNCDIDIHRPRTAMGLDASGRYLFMIATSGNSNSCVNLFGGIPLFDDRPQNGMSAFQISGLLRMSRSISNTEVRAENAIMLDGGHSPTMRTGDSLVVKSNASASTAIPAEGAYVIAGLAVIHEPTSSPIQTEPSCTDGMRNQDELGTDCGGVCKGLAGYCPLGPGGDGYYCGDTSRNQDPKNLYYCVNGLWDSARTRNCGSAGCRRNDECVPDDCYLIGSGGASSTGSVQSTSTVSAAAGGTSGSGGTQSVGGSVTSAMGGSSGTPRCGNDVLDPGEQCDLSNLNERLCTSLGFAGGILKCQSNCTLDTSGCSGCGQTCGECRICNESTGTCEFASDGAPCPSGTCQGGTCQPSTCDDPDGDHHGPGCEYSGDCDPSECLTWTGAQERFDVADNDCDGEHDNAGLLHLDRYFHDSGGSNFEHRFATSQPGPGWEPDDHWIEILPNDFCTNPQYRPQSWDGTPLCTGPDAEGVVSVKAPCWSSSYAFVQLMECRNTSSEWTIYLPRDSTEFQQVGTDWTCLSVPIGYVATSDATGTDGHYVRLTRHDCGTWTTSMWSSDSAEGGTDCSHTRSWYAVRAN